MVGLRLDSPSNGLPRLPLLWLDVLSSASLVAGCSEFISVRHPQTHPLNFFAKKQIEHKELPGELAHLAHRQGEVVLQRLRKCPRSFVLCLNSGLLGGHQMIYQKIHLLMSRFVTGGHHFPGKAQDSSQPRNRGILQKG